MEHVNAHHLCMISHNLLNVFYLNKIVFLVCVWIILESLIFILISQLFSSLLCLSDFQVISRH